VLAGQSPPVAQGPGGADREGDRRSLAQARGTARAFMRAFLRYQRGDFVSRIAVVLRNFASASIRRSLIAAPPRIARRVRRTRTRSFRLWGPRRGKLKASVLLVAGGQSSLFEFLLERRNGRWRVAEIYP
jgi:hypothetical protein